MKTWERMGERIAAVLQCQKSCTQETQNRRLLLHSFFFFFETDKQVAKKVFLVSTNRSFLFTKTET